jgi:long-chain acyl-CoA synthetase
MHVANLVRIFRVQAERFGPRPAIRFRRYGRYCDMTWEQYHEAARACASALIEAGIEVGDRVGLLAENSREWLIADMGILLAGAVNVPPHAPLAARQAQFQLHNSQARWLFVSTAGQMEKIRAVRAELPDLQGVVSFGAKLSGEDYLAWPSFLQKGRQLLPGVEEELRQREQALTADSLATIMYTSGTTGNPKGVMLTHGNLVSNAQSVEQSYPREPDAVALSWLPLSHIYARTVDHYLCLATGTLLCLAESAETVVRDLAETQPTHLSCVPRFYEKLLAAVEGPDPAVMQLRLRAVFGPRMSWLGSGGAPLPGNVARQYLKGGFTIYQGYGLTETSPVMTFNCPGQNKLDSVGKAIPGVEIKIAPDGEILTRGPQVMRGYWNNPGATEEAIRDGWFHTGDLGYLDDEGYLFITGRKKELLVLSNGKKVIPTVLEGMLVSDPVIDQAVVYGEGKNYLSALIVPNWDILLAALGDASLPPVARSQLTEHPQVTAFLRTRIDQLLAEVSNWEQIKCFVVLAEPFSVAAEELTVSLKMRRNVIFENHWERIQAMYDGK